MDIRVYYEDTDSGGVVYYANYLRYFERDRTEYFRGHEIGVAEYDAKGVLFVVANVEVAYRASARLDDLLEVRSKIVDYSRVCIIFSQRIFRKHDDKLLVDGTVRLACTGPDGRPRSLPDEVRKLAQRESGRIREREKTR